eukprot:1142553-Pelagomonas_calceolata.AAC.4
MQPRAAFRAEKPLQHGLHKQKHEEGNGLHWEQQPQQGVRIGSVAAGYTLRLIRHVCPKWLNLSATDNGLYKEPKFQFNQLGHTYAKEHAKNT